MTWFERVNRMKSENVYKVCKYFYLNYDIFYYLALEYSDTGCWYPFSLGSNVELWVCFALSAEGSSGSRPSGKGGKEGSHQDPDISGVGEFLKNVFQPFGPQFGLNIRGATPPLGLSPGSATGGSRWSIGGPGGSLLRCCTGPLRGFLKKQDVNVIQCNQVYFECL